MEVPGLYFKIYFFTCIFSAFLTRMNSIRCRDFIFSPLILLQSMPGTWWKLSKYLLSEWENLFQEGPLEPPLEVHSTCRLLGGELVSALSYLPIQGCGIFLFIVFFHVLQRKKSSCCCQNLDSLRNWCQIEIMEAEFGKNKEVDIFFARQRGNTVG